MTEKGFTKHTYYTCNKCDKSFDTEKECEEHIQELHSDTSFDDAVKKYKFKYYKAQGQDVGLFVSDVYKNNSPYIYVEYYTIQCDEEYGTHIIDCCNNGLSYFKRVLDEVYGCTEITRLEFRAIFNRIYENMMEHNWEKLIPNTEGE